MSPHDPAGPPNPTTAVVGQVLDDLAAEGDALEALVARLDEAGWRRATPAPGWAIAHQIAHLAWTDEVAVIAATDPAEWDAVVLRALDDPTGFVDAMASAGADASGPEILARWRTARAALAHVLRDRPTGEKLPWFGPPMSPASMATARLMETWAHGLDVADALGVEVIPTDRVRHVAHLAVRTRDFSFGVHDLEPPAQEFRIELTAPSGEVWAWGPPDAEQRITGPAWDFCLLAVQRRHRDDLALLVVGHEADRWLDIAQAFAGPPGVGRAPTGAGAPR